MLNSLKRGPSLGRVIKQLEREIAESRALSNIHKATRTGAMSENRPPNLPRIDEEKEEEWQGRGPAHFVSVRMSDFTAASAPQLLVERL